MNLSAKNELNQGCADNSCIVNEQFQKMTSHPRRISPLPEVLHTDRLTLRPYKETDLDDMMEYATDPRWAKFLPVPQPYERTHAADFIKSQLSLDRLTFPSWAIQFAGKVVGGINVGFDFNSHVSELGYSISPSVWGQGLITEAVRKIIDISFETYPNLRRMTATADAENLGSLRVMEKLGMKRENLLRQHPGTNGKFVDVITCSLLREDWGKK